MSFSLRQRRILFASIGCMVTYGAVLLVLDHTVKSDDLWRELLKTPTARTDVMISSAAYAVLSGVLALLWGWQPNEAPVKGFRRSLIGLTVLAMLGPAFMLVVVVINLDCKMSL